MGTLTRNFRGLLDVLLENDSLIGSLSKKSSLSVFSTWHNEYLAGGCWPSKFTLQLLQWGKKTSLSGFCR